MFGTSTSVRSLLAFGLCALILVDSRFAEAKELSEQEIVSQNIPPGAASQIEIAKKSDVTNPKSLEVSNRFIRVHWDNETEEKNEEKERRHRDSDEYLVAIYSVNFFNDSWIRVFQLGQKSQFKVVYDVPFNIAGTVDGKVRPSFLGTDKTPIIARDVDGDRKSEIVVTTKSERSQVVGKWVFRWDGKALLPMTPYNLATGAKSRGGVLSSIKDAYLQDISGDGKLDLISVVSSSKMDEDLPDGTSPNDLLDVYSPIGDKYQLSKHIYYYRYFEYGQPTGWWTNPYDTFQLADSTKSYVVTVFVEHPENPKGIEVQLSVNGQPLAGKEGKILVTKKPQSYSFNAKTENQVLIKFLTKEKGRVTVIVEEKH